MTRERWLILLIVVVALTLCCAVTVCAFAGFAWFSSAAVQSGPMEVEEARQTPPTAQPAPRAATPSEMDTARLAEETLLPPRDLVGLAQRLKRVSSSYLSIEPDTPPDYDLGDELTFWVHNVEDGTFFARTAILQNETAHAYWWVEEGYDLPADDLERSAEAFEERTYPTTRRVFGSEANPGVDGDPHVYIYLGDVPGVGGYFSGPDSMPAEVSPYSNEHEMFYINLENAQPGNDYFDGILAHEFQHMIQHAMDRNEDTWVNEGLSELAAQVNGYDVGGSSFAFGRAPDTQLNTWADLEDSAAHYGASYMLLAYVHEQFGEEAIRQLAADQANGIAGFEAVLSSRSGQAVELGNRETALFLDLFADWTIANYLDDPDLADGRWGYAGLSVDEPAHARHYTRFPARHQAAVSQFATDYNLLEGEGDLVIDFQGNQLVPLIGNLTQSGEVQWWSNRGDDGDATLTRAFDLSTVDRATLKAWIWHELELDYDYAYVEVSTDRGHTWDLLANENTTEANPSGNSYGPGFTGNSGGGEEPVWVEESFDLTPYAGRQILVRFEVITDEALNSPGLCLDGISIPELGYAHDPDEGDEGWQAEGWLRVTDHIPQQFLIHLITFGRQVRVERIVLDNSNHATVAVDGLGRTVDRAVLVVSGTAPVTTEPAAYTLEISQP